MDFDNHAAIGLQAGNRCSVVAEVTTVRWSGDGLVVGDTPGSDSAGRDSSLNQIITYCVGTALKLS